MASRKRARKEEEKQERRTAILTAASDCLRPRRFDDVTMAEIAARCGLAKGSLYLYFSTKEELFLAVLELELETWLDDMGGTLGERGPIDAQTFARLVVRTLCPREMLMDLLALRRTMVEQSSRDQSSWFSRMLRDKLAALAAELEGALPLGPGGGASLLARTFALVVGLRLMSHSPESSIQQSEPGPLRADFEADVLGSLTAIANGILDAEARRRSRLVVPNDESRPHAPAGTAMNT